MVSSSDPEPPEPLLLSLPNAASFVFRFFVTRTSRTSADVFVAAPRERKKKGECPKHNIEHTVCGTYLVGVRHSDLVAEEGSGRGTGLAGSAQPATGTQSGYRLGEAGVLELAASEVLVAEV